MNKELVVDLVLTVLAVVLVAAAIDAAVAISFGGALLLSVAALLVVVTGNRLTRLTDDLARDKPVDTPTLDRRSAV